MATFDYSDTQVQFQALAQQRKDREERRARTQQAATSLGVNAWKAWSGSQQSNYKGLMDMKDPGGQNVWQQSESYRKSGPLKKMFTPSGGRVELTDAGKDYQTTGKQMSGATDTYNQGLKDNPWLTEVDDFGAPAVSGKDIADAGVTGADLSKQGGKIASLTDAGPQTFSGSLKEMGKDVSGKVGKVAGGLGVAAGAYGLGKNWKKMSKGQKVAGVGSLGLGVASMFVPGLGVANLLAGLGKGLIK